MIAIVIFAQHLCHFVVALDIFSGKFIDPFLEVIMYLLGSNSTYGGICFLHGDIIQVVQTAKNIDLREFRHPGKHDDC